MKWTASRIWNITLVADVPARESSGGISCPSCHAPDSRLIGVIPPSCTFAGCTLDQELSGGDLRRCSGCHILFRHPFPSQQDLDRLYRSGHPESWATPFEQRTDWKLVSRWLGTTKGIKRILDVGCFDGRLLEFIGQEYEWVGVEMHEEAARRARNRGVDVVCTDFAGLSELQINADAALAVDVIEHSPDPREFLASLVSNVRPGGYIVVTTGNSEALSWRLMGSRYWYCHIAEHLTFISPAWARQVAPRLGLTVEHLGFFSHADGARPLARVFYESSSNFLLRFAPRLFAALRRHGVGGIDLERFPGLAYAPPYWMTAKDHLMVCFQRQQ